MVIICVSLFLIFVGVFLFFSKNKVKDVLIKNKTRISGVAIIKNKFFISKNNSFNLYQILTNGLVIFDKQEKYDEMLKTFSSSGIDVLLPFFKYECYEKVLNIEKLYKTLKLVKQLDDNKILFNFFVFYNNYKFFKSISKLIKYFSFKYVKTRIYNSCEIDYKLLSFINLLDLNPQNQILKNKQNKIQNPIGNFLKNTYDNSIIKNLPTQEKQEGLFFYSNNQVFYENNYVYSNLTQQSFLDKNKINIKINKTFNFKFLLDIYKIQVTNSASTMQTLSCCFGTIFKNKTLRNGIYLVNSKKDRISVTDNLHDKFLCLLGSFEKHFCLKNYFYALKKLTLQPNQTIKFFFAVSNTQNSTNKNIISFSDNNFEDFYNKTLQDYSSVKIPKVLSENKVLNYLINEMLPNKIIQESIVKGRLTFDFDNFLNKKFDKNLIDKNVCDKNLKSYFLLNHNFFKTYLNLFYFYLGFWQNKTGLNINQDKTFVLNQANVLTYNQFSPFNINIKNNNLKNEIEVNSVKFTNLNSISINSFIDKNLNLLF